MGKQKRKTAVVIDWDEKKVLLVTQTKVDATAIVEESDLCWIDEGDGSEFIDGLKKELAE